VIPWLVTGGFTKSINLRSDHRNSAICIEVFIKEIKQYCKLSKGVTYTLNTMKPFVAKNNKKLERVILFLALLLAYAGRVSAVDLAGIVPVALGIWLVTRPVPQT